MTEIELWDGTKARPRLGVSDQEALIDELMALVDFGQAIKEPYVQIAAERCLRIILRNEQELALERELAGASGKFPEGQKGEDYGEEAKSIWGGKWGDREKHEVKNHILGSSGSAKLAPAFTVVVELMWQVDIVRVVGARPSLRLIVRKNRSPRGLKNDL